MKQNRWRPGLVLLIVLVVVPLAGWLIWKKGRTEQAAEIDKAPADGIGAIFVIGAGNQFRQPGKRCGRLRGNLAECDAACLAQIAGALSISAACSVRPFSAHWPASS